MSTFNSVYFVDYDESMRTEMIALILLREREYQRRVGPSRPQIRKIEDIPKMQRDLMSKSALEESKNFGICQEIIDLEQKYKLKELKELVSKNHILKEDVIGNKGHKRTWSKALYKSTKWGFNSFVVGVNKEKGHPLRGQIDVLLMIQDKL
tara:strand:+ start:5674 stop:6126 length:453 start_codon:yes stop_codon:yes gene_type:complete